MRDAVEAVVEAYIRPSLRAHGGDMKVLAVEDGVVRFQLTGCCSGCPAAYLTTEALIQAELTQRTPGITRAVLVQEVSDDLLDQAKAILRRDHGR